MVNFGEKRLSNSLFLDLGIGEIHQGGTRGGEKSRYPGKKPHTRRDTFIVLYAPSVFSLLRFALSAFVASSSTSKVSGSIMTP